MYQSKTKAHLLYELPFILLLHLFIVSFSFGQSYYEKLNKDSARSDKLTGGSIEKADFVAGDDDVRLTANVPAFQLTFWQNGREVKNYLIGVGQKDYPIFVGPRVFDRIIWNPDWAPPDSDWVAPALKGKIIKASDPRNPLGKIKIPLGHGYLIHQAKGRGDLGNLVSHGCMRVMLNDLYDLNEKIVSAYSIDVPAAQIARAKRTKNKYEIRLPKLMPIEVTYDTLVVEAGQLHIYPDVYGYEKNTVANLRKELSSNGIDDAKISDAVLKKMLLGAKAKKQYVISLENIRNGNFARGKIIPVLPGR